MNIKGQYNKLNKWQKNTLRHFAVKKNWNAYWGFKYKCLIQYEERQAELERSVEGSVLV